MNRFAVRIFVVPFLLGAFLTTLDVAAQDRYGQIVRTYDRPQAYHEAAVLPGADAAQAIVAFRIPHSLLVFVQDEDAFVARPEVTVELFRDGVPVEERAWQQVRRVASFASTQSEVEAAEGHVVFSLQPGTYAYELTLGTEASGVVGTARPRPFEVPDFSSYEDASPFFGEIVTGEGRTRIEFANLGGAVPFARSTSLVVASTTPMVRPSYRILRIERRPRRPIHEPHELDGSEPLISEGTIDEPRSEVLGPIHADCLCWHEAGAGFVTELNIGTMNLPNGAYVVDLEWGPDADRTKRQVTFETLWPDMPLSLYDVDVAVRHLEYMIGREAVKELNRGSRSERIERFEAFWDSRDPTPGTVYNELMVEYYSRIDAAARRFQTGRVPYPDGLRTDAARVYIVHGPPDRTADAYPSSGGVEQMWTYDDGRTFVFWAASSLDPWELLESRSSRVAVP